MALSDAGQLREAIAEYGRAIELDPNNAAAYSNRCGVLTYIGRYDRAIADCDRALELDPSDVQAYVHRGSAYDEKGELERALANYDRAIQLAPDYAFAYRHRAVTRIRTGQYEEALPDLDRAIGLDPLYWFAYVSRATALALLRRYGEAAADYRKALALGPPGWHSGGPPVGLGEPVRVAPDLRVARSVFGSMAADGDFALGHRFPPGALIGWALALDTPRESVRWRQRLIQVAAEGEWKEMAVEGDAKPDEAKEIFHFWPVQPGEEIRICEVYIEDRLVHLTVYSTTRP